jgi:hypothetical protein
MAINVFRLLLISQMTNPHCREKLEGKEMNAFLKRGTLEGSYQRRRKCQLKISNTLKIKPPTQRKKNYRHTVSRPKKGEEKLS